VIDDLPGAAVLGDGAETGGAFAVTAARSAWRIGAGATSETGEWLAEEVPVALVYNGISHVVMLATPCDLEDFAVGFSFTEGVVEGADDVRGVEVAEACGGIEVRVDISARAFAGLKDQRRQLAGRTGCGICGAESIERAIRPVVPVAHRPRVVLARVSAALEAMDAAQSIRNDTGATHGAAWVGADGRLRLCREDVGRHNALDKLIGGMQRQGIAPSDIAPQSGFALISSRASYEMVQKAARAGIGAVVAVSAPTALAVRVAEQAGVALACWARGDRLTAYTFPEVFAT
jgi:FdhD protein